LPDLLTMPDLTIVVGLGSNLGDRLANLRRAVGELAAASGLTVLARSSVFETEPAGGPPQPDYLNAAVLLRSALCPAELCARTAGIEQALGRVRPDAVRWGPRTMDIDLLWSEGLVLDEPELQLPHPRLGDRPFALQPLLELVPDACDPRTLRAYLSLPAASRVLRRVARL
jgi:2-amino-4-hydroxy-6-hydroxymethyldihydropteridine diphosphokinase